MASSSATGFGWEKWLKMGENELFSYMELTDLAGNGGQLSGDVRGIWWADVGVYWGVNGGCE